MKHVRIEILLEAKQPIAHHQESIGNTAIFMREKVRYKGSFVNVPYITGDTMRHGLRECGTYALLEAAGMLDDPSLSEAAVRLLFAGGMVTGSGGAVKLSDYYELVDLCPHLALLGGCAANRVIPGKLNADFCRLVCEENAQRLPQWVHDWCAEKGEVLSPARPHLASETRVRMDPMLDPSKRRMLTAGASAEAEQRLLKSENASAHDDHAEKDANKSSMMPRSSEVIVAGSHFFWSLDCLVHTPLDESTLYVCLSAFMNRCHVGGKRGTGHGKLWPVAARNVELPRWDDYVRSDASGLVREGDSMGKLFMQHVAERKDKLRTYLATVAA